MPADSDAESDAPPVEDKPAEDAKEDGEVASESKEPEKKPEPPAPKASAWASLNKREQALVEKQNAWAKEREELAARAAEADKIRERAKEDVFEALKMLGHEDPRKFLEKIAETGGRLTPEQKRIAELENMVKADREERERLTNEARQRQEAEQLEAKTKEWHASIAAQIKDDPELKDGLASVSGVEPAVFRVMQAHYEETQEVMPVRDAAKIVEKDLEDRVTAMLNDIVATKRGRQVFDTIATKIAQPAPARKKAPQGITQRISNTTGAKRTKPPRFEDALDQAANWLNSQSK